MASSSELSLLSWREIGRSYFNTSLFCLAIGCTIWILGWASPLWAAFVVSFCIGFSINTTSLILKPFEHRRIPLILSLLTTLLGVGFGIMLAGFLVVDDPLFFLADDDYSTPILGVFFGVLGFLFFTNQQRLRVAETELANARAAELNREKENLETQLRLLQAQIEPHFLFNTLSNVVGMIRDRPVEAEQMLLHLTALLRASLAKSRQSRGSLADELELIEALLKINQIRMGDRLQYQITADEEANATEIPPMLLQPLVENAIKHGIEPLEDGGNIELTASVTDDRLQLTVTDTGCGSSADHHSDGSGVGISNVENRLAALYGAEASLSLRENYPSGMVVTLSLPVHA